MAEPLILVPTELEAELSGLDRRHMVICGFGLVEAAVTAAAAFAEHRPTSALLLGTAGSYDLDRTPVGSAVLASSVRCVGIGAAGLGAAELGWTDTDVLDVTANGDGEVLSVAAASGDPAEAARRAERYPQAVAEEMEAFAVALAARRFGVQLTVLRGISNAAGDRDRSGWRMADAMRAAAGRSAALVYP